MLIDIDFMGKSPLEIHLENSGDGKQQLKENQPFPYVTYWTHKELWEYDGICTYIYIYIHFTQSASVHLATSQRCKWVGLAPPHGSSKTINSYKLQ